MQGAVIGSICQQRSHGHELWNRWTYDVSAFGGRLLRVGGFRLVVADHAVELTTGSALAPSKMSISPPLGQWCSYIATRLRQFYAYRDQPL